MKAGSRNRLTDDAVISRSLQLAIIGLCVSCGTVSVNGLENSVDCTAVTPTPTFAATVVPLFSSRGCSASSCHAGASAAGNLDLSGSAATIYSDITSSGVIDLTTDPADPLNAVLIAKPLKGLLPHEGGDIFESLDDSGYQQIYCWIDAGANND